MSSKILVVGSVAFDVIFSIPQDFRDSIPLENGKIRNFNATYIANEKQEFPGGTAGNIAFWLGQQEIKSDVFTAWGKDFSQKGYKQKLTDLGQKIHGTAGLFTAHAYMVSDPIHQQLIIWQPNAYELNETQKLADAFSDEKLASFEYAIFSPGSPASMVKQMQELREKNKTAKIILDPGQVSPFFGAENFAQASAVADILIGNDIEFTHFKKYGINNHLIQIETLGERGVRLKLNKDYDEVFVAEKVNKVVETTGAGDAFRAGLLTKLSQNKNWEEAIKNGCKFGAKCVQLPSGQI